MVIRSRLSVGIVGGGFGGLCAAVHAAAAGLRVTVYEKESQVGGRANRLDAAGFAFDTGPSLLNYPWVFEELFAAAGRRLCDYVELRPVEPTMRFLWPDGETLTLSSDLTFLLQELHRHESGAAGRLARWLADGERRFNLVLKRIATLDETNPLAYAMRAGMLNMLRAGVFGSFERSLRRFFRSRQVLDALGAYAMYLGGSPSDLPAALSVLPYGEIAGGLWFPKGGVYALVRAVAALAQELGAELRASSEVAEVVVRNGRVYGATTRDGAFHHHDVVIVNADAPAARVALLPGQGGAPRMPEMTPSVVTFYLGLKRPPEGLGHHTVFLPRDSRETYADLLHRFRVPSEPAFYAAVPSLGDPGLAPEGGATLFILVPGPVPDLCPEAEDAELPRRFRSRVMERMRSHGIVVPDEDVLFEEVWTPRRWQERFHLHQASAFGAAHLLRQIGPWRWPNRDPSVGGLYYVGASTVPGTGLPMVTLGAGMVVRRLLRDAC